MSAFKLDAWTRTLCVLAHAARHPEQAGAIDPALVAAGVPRQLLALVQARPAEVRAHGLGLVATAEVRPLWVANLIEDAARDPILAMLGEDLVAAARPTTSLRDWQRARDAAARALTSAATA